MRKIPSKTKIKKRVVPVKSHKKRHHKDYGTSNLELKFAHDFLEKLGQKYIYQFSAEEIGRFYDFAIVENQEQNYITEERDGLTSVKQAGQFVPIAVLIEVDGDYW